MTDKYKDGCFVDDNGYIRDVAAPGFGMSCKVEGDTVLLLAEEDLEAGGCEVLGEFTWYASLDELKKIGFAPRECGKVMPL